MKRSPARTGALGVLVVLLATLSAFYLDALPIIGAGSTYKAEFTEAAGLKADNEVRVAGVKVGKVTDVALEGDKVVVSFRVQDTWIGNSTNASIQIKTILGQKYLALEPNGDEPLDPADRIPLARTIAPFDVMQAFEAAGQTVGEIDNQQLANSFDTLTEAFSGVNSPDLHAALSGVSRLSETIASRDEQLKKLLAATSDTTQILADRNEEFTRLLSDGGLLLAELNNRQEAIGRLLDGTIRLSDQLTALVAENREQIGPALDQLRGVVQILQDNNDSLDRAMKLYEPFVRLYTNVTGNGRWFDQVVVNLTPPALPEIPGDRPPVRTLEGGN